MLSHFFAFWKKVTNLPDQLNVVFVAFDEGVRILIVTFFRNQSRGFYGSVPRVSNRCQAFLGFSRHILGWLADLASISCRTKRRSQKHFVLEKMDEACVRS